MSDGLNDTRSRNDARQEVLCNPHGLFGLATASQRPSNALADIGAAQITFPLDGNQLVRF